MEILKFDAGKRTSLLDTEPTTGVTSNVKTNQSLKRKLIAGVTCASITGISGGCCSNDTNPSSVN
ncbi:MAG: hypothetical protein GQ564_04600 [Bacteroidales bacterium]|nr:hypothetical protein [Bacteroidales bacterium]